ncbi:BID domain-containing T4SS effector [Bartonella phoceensis]|uniref:BID domain-containing T4SS effector n=1 Tax=Bartonella phoceensis TaxID=270249 RepID=UPI001ABB6FD9|nr:BID domain-containing T4SS effector [Bartonella phoceensis]
MIKNQTNHSVFPKEDETAKIPQAVDTIDHTAASLALQNFFYTENTVLKNKRGIKESGAFKEQCTRDIEAAKTKLHCEPLPKKFDSHYLRHIHHNFFKDMFEWAGCSRESPFTFADGNTASAPFLKKNKFKKPFASGEEIEKKLDEIDKMIAEKNNLQNLSREEFVKHAAEIMLSLHYTHPFVAGSIPVIQYFVEKLGQAAKHPLDFSLLTRKREDLAYTAAINEGNKEPMMHLLEDISNPSKSLLLSEFTTEMKRLGLHEENYRPAVVAQDGHIYRGIYRGCGEKGFMVDVNGTLVLGHKNDLSPRQLHKLKIGDSFTFTAPLPQKLQKFLIPEKILAPLSQKEVFDAIEGNELIQRHKSRIADLCKTVYGKEHVLEDKLRDINQNPSNGYQIVTQMHQSMRSLSRLAGFEICGIRNRARTLAEEELSELKLELCFYANATLDLERDLLRKHFDEQKRCKQPIEMPSKKIQDLFCLSNTEQRKALLTSPELEKQVANYFQKLKGRLLPSECQAIQQRDHTKLAESLNISVHQAEQVAECFQQIEKINLNIEHVRMSKTFLERGTPPHTVRIRELYETSSPGGKTDKGLSFKVYELSPRGRKRASTMQEKYDQEKQADSHARMCKDKPLRVKAAFKNLTF